MRENIYNSLMFIIITRAMMMDISFVHFYTS